MILQIFNSKIIILIIILFIIGFGIVALYSAGYNKPIYKDIYFTQFIWFILGLIVIILIYSLRSHLIYNYSMAIYFVVLFFLIMTLIFGKEIRNTRGWLTLGSLNFQFSEIAKLSTILFLGRYIDYHFREFHNFKDFFVPFVIVLIPVGLILMQPDLGSTLVFFPIIFVMLILGGAQMRYIFYLLLIVCISVFLPLVISYFTFIEDPSKHVWIKFFTDKNILLSILILLFLTAAFLKIIYTFYPKYKILNLLSTLLFIILIGLYFFFIINNKLKPYQKKRLLVFIDSKIDPYGSGYNITQSKITMGSGKLLGQGYLKGSQTQLGFLPEQTTDFIISVIGEEFGWVGMSLILLLYYLFIMMALKIVYNARDSYTALVSAGITTMFIFQIFINVGMTLGIMPVTGIPLPFLSYGGSSLITSMMGVALLMNLQSRR